jgi:S1-C subfamily serine protease
MTSKPVKKLFKPAEKNSKPAGNISAVPERKVTSQRKISSSYFPVILLAGLMFFVILLAVIIVKSHNYKRPAVYSNSEKYPKEAPSLEKRPERILPDGELGEWAKAVVFLETGTLEGNNFYPQKSGSGFLISRDGKILTNNHVIEGGRAVLATFYDGSTELVNIVKTDPELDAALLQCSGKTKIPVLKLSEETEVRIGRKILVMGFPLGASLGEEMTLTDGLVSSIRKNETDQIIWYQVSAAVNPGNSGGPLIDAQSGKVLGIVTAKINEAENIGFARPISLVENRLIDGSL